MVNKQSDNFNKEGIINMSHGKIVVIDDEEDNCVYLKEIISKTGYEVETFCDSSEALAKIKDSIPAMIFLDIQMPGMNGFEVLKVIRETDSLSEVPVVFLSAISSITGEEYDPETIQSKYGVRPDAFIPKMIEPAVIQEHLNRFIKDKS